MSDRTKAILIRFALILTVTDLPILSAALVAPVFDWRLLLSGLLTGALAAYEKLASPQLATTILPGATIMPPAWTGAPPQPLPVVTELPPH